ncbi:MULTISPECIES: hypothetical protein [unclassified Micromonospora]|uniref:hypothetical protein n=1 Tax=unclassified Micromonospora TaxID=2617518 RepID=UPI002FF33BAE
MSFLTKIAGGVALGSAALLLSAPAAALAAPDETPKEPKATSEGQKTKSQGQTSKKKKPDDKPQTFSLRDKEGNGVTCATSRQVNKLNVSNIISDNTITDSVVVFNQAAAGATSNTGGQLLIVCIRDLDVEADVETDLLGDLLKMVETGIGGVGAPAGQRAGSLPATGGAYAGPEGAWALPRTGGVAAGDGGALSGTNTGALTATGAGMLGVAALGGIALLRRRSANGTPA